MFRVKIHKHIERSISLFYRVGFWTREDEQTVAERRLKLFYSIYYSLFPISLIAGASTSDNMDEFVLLTEASMMSSVFLVKLLYLIWKKKEIVEQLNRICDYCVEDQETFTKTKNNLNILMKFAAIFFGLCYFFAFCLELVVPFMGTEKKLFFNIGFPLDWRNDEFAYWVAFVFSVTQVTIIVISMLFSAYVWYFMANCGLRFKVLGQQIKSMGEIISSEEDEAPKRKILKAERNNLYLRDLLAVIRSHRSLTELTDQLYSFISNIFVVQLTTSGLCICTSIYCIAFNRGDNLIELLINLIILIYNIFDIFMIMYFGNEIQLASDRLSYCLFESDWVDRSQSIKKNVLIFGEFLMQPYQLVVLKLYPLTLETFTRILNSAYSSFNILQNFK